MKLRNKKTGEIVEVESLYLTQTQELYLSYINEENKQKVYMTDKIASFNLDWEDYEEPKEDGLDNIIALVEAYSSHDSERYPKEIVEKLKAWKRLEDKGFRFTGINDDEDSQELITQCGILCEADIYHLAKDEDFLLLFGGEDE